ncbi:MAG: hypothetical protein U0W24_04015 [Bacteroidales bacterium]
MKTLKFLLIFILIIAVAYFVFQEFSGFQDKKIKNLEEKIALLKEEHVPLRFRISEKTNDSVFLTLKFYNASNKEINSLNTALPGQELSFDFQVVPVKGRYVAFPSKIFSNVIAAANGEELYKYYDKEGFPGVFYNDSLDQDLKTVLTDLFTKIKTGETDSLENNFGSMVHDIKNLKSFLPDVVYAIVCHTKGGIEIKEE